MKAVIEIKGGFGNQIFQFAFAKHLSDLGVNVFVNYQNYTIFNLNYKYFGFRKASPYFVYILKFLYKLFESKKYSFLYKVFFKNYFNKFSKPDEFNSKELKALNHFDGYWQDVQMLDKNKAYIIESLDKYSSFSYYKNSSKLHGLTLLHVRRGDYLKIKENLKLDFYKQAIIHCRENIKEFKFDIFTDDVNWVKDQELFEDAMNVFGPSKDLHTLLNEVSNMMKYENFIVGNSSFSLIPAILSKNKATKIFVADPWFKNSSRDLNFDDSYLKLRNKNY